MSIAQGQLELKKCSLETALSLGKKLRENPKTGQVTSVKDSMAKLSTSWSNFEELLRENVEQVRMRWDSPLAANITMSREDRRLFIFNQSGVKERRAASLLC